MTSFTFFTNCHSAATRYLGMLPCMAAFLLGLALPTSTFLVNFALVLALICVLLKSNSHHMKVLAQHPLIWLPAIMFLLLAFSLLSQQNPYGSEMVNKYKKLLYVMPLALFFLLSRSLITYFIKGFLLANVVILVASLLIAIFHLPLGSGSPSNATVFKLHITQNFFMALAAVIWLAQAFTHQGIKRCGYALLVCIAIYNVFFMVEGRTGYAALIVAFIIWMFLSLSPRQKLGTAMGALVLGCILVMVPNNASDRVKIGIEEIQRCMTATDKNSSTSCYSSMGLRTVFALRSLQLIKQAPLFGHGAGSFFYSIPAEGYSVNNPHNEYLIQTVQSGLVGLALFLGWMLCFFCAAWQQATMVRNLFIALFSSYVVGHFFNSFLLDFSEGHLFVVLTAILASYSLPAQDIKEQEDNF
ncbi:O-antigen ligase family protein [Candidatus Fukatsuia symbiotica]|uniref:O-antigen ligase family protein n=1 Tax=Candidatus Fukatsuia TaxID=1927833 RepID=UPI000932CD1D|nr:O-antigen ligase family protein [Candidatus Fukatsuia symbiotica]MEA9444191.1 O-antigen ligase family protein [Candidatus Fukatsuia symbiotica]